MFTTTSISVFLVGPETPSIVAYLRIDILLSGGPAAGGIQHPTSFHRSRTRLDVRLGARRMRFNTVVRKQNGKRTNSLLGDYLDYGHLNVADYIREESEWEEIGQLCQVGGNPSYRTGDEVNVLEAVVKAHKGSRLDPVRDWIQGESRLSRSCWGYHHPAVRIPFKQGFGSMGYSYQPVHLERSSFKQCDMVARSRPPPFQVTDGLCTTASSPTPPG